MGGQVASSAHIDNYLGFPHTTGNELSMRFKEHVKSLEIPTLSDRVKKVERNGDHIIVEGKKNSYEAVRVVLATGVRPQKLGIPGEDTHYGRGVSYCATCDGAFFKGLDVAVIGGGDSALTESIYLSNIVKKVYIIHRRDEFRGLAAYQKLAAEIDNIEFLLSHVPEEIVGERIVEGLILRDLKNDKQVRLDVNGVFVYVGNVPNTTMVECDKDERGFIITDEKLMTSIPGIYAAGDCRVKDLRQIVTAVADGAIAGWNAAKDAISLRSG